MSQVKKTKHAGAILTWNSVETWISTGSGMGYLSSGESLCGANNWRLMCPIPFSCLNTSTGLV